MARRKKARVKDYQKPPFKLSNLMVQHPGKEKLAVSVCGGRLESLITTIKNSGKVYIRSDREREDAATPEQITLYYKSGS